MVYVSAYKTKALELTPSNVGCAPLPEFQVGDLVLYYQHGVGEINPGSQKVDPTLQTSPRSANLLRDGLELVNYSAFCRPTTKDPPKTI
ncbi:hypothetical protein DSO57_1004719 [Entomophthora muscae]|uniref:Uncharacterized protein n=1 Tax=Entomophthora muscae TaxID=34485 RepID=A0ACC2SXF3_9FUNG|nr:hypothetical protein DSO57_1004719 [Entomophthora muscae]